MKFLSHVELNTNMYIDTGFKPNQDTRVIMDVELGGVSTSLFAFFGVRDTNSTTSAKQFISWAANTSSAIRSDYFGTSVSEEVTLSHSRFIVDQNRNLCTAKGVTTVNTVATGQCTYNLFIGAVNNVGTYSYGMIGKIYSCKVYDNDELIRDYIPAMTDDGVAGLWDKVEGVFYVSGGSSAFIAGGIKSIGMISHLFTGLENGKTYYARVFTINPKGRVNNRVDLPWASAIPSSFPEEPTAYNLIGTYTIAQPWTAPENGYFQIEVFGASGNGGNALRLSDTDDDDKPIYYVSGGGGGGGGAYACSIVKLNKGDTIVTSSFDVGSVATVYINSSIETYSNMLVTSGSDGTSSTWNGLSGYSSATGGNGGSASGGNISNISGSKGGNGTAVNAVSSRNDADSYGGTGGAAGYTGGNAGGKGGYFTDYSSSTAAVNGKTAFIKISRGNTNNVA